MDYPSSDDLHNGKFTDGDPILGIPASIMSAEHMNTLYDELISLIRFVGAEPSYEKRDQLMQALEFYRDASNLNAGKVPPERLSISPASKDAILAGTSNDVYVTPKGLEEADVFADFTGSIHWFATQAAPAGFIKANGAAISRTQYANLFDKIGITYGGGDGINTFNVPDLRGEFVRGWDDGRGVDVDRELGSYQGDAFQGHRHRVLGNILNRSGIGSRNFGNDNDQAYSGTKIVGDPIDDGVNGAPRISSETRPRNIALIAYIKY